MTNLSRLAVPLAAAAVFVAAAAAIANLDPEGDKFQVDAVVGGAGFADNQSNRTVDRAADDSFVAVWADFADGPAFGTSFGVSARRFDSGGNALTGNVQVNSYTTGRQNWPSVASRADGSFMVTWTNSPDNTTSGQDISGRLFDSDGTPLTDEFTANTTTADTQAQSTVAALSNDGFVITWIGVNAGTAFDVFAQRFDEDGVALGTEFAVNSNLTLSQELPSAAATSDGFIVAWGSQDCDGNQFGVCAQRFDNSGAKVGTEFTVNTYTTDNQTQPAVAVNSDDSFVITWMSDGQDGSRNGIYAQRFSSMGVAVGTEFPVTQTTDGDQKYPTVSFGQGGFVVAWQDKPILTTLNSVAARCFDTDASPLTDEFEVDAPPLPGAGAEYPSVAGDADGDFIVTWNAPSLLQMSGTAIRAQRYSTPGSAVCGDPVDPAALVVGRVTIQTINASDALFVLRAGVGSEVCELCVCDVDNGGDINASDALLVLQKGVGQPVVLNCPACT